MWKIWNVGEQLLLKVVDFLQIMMIIMGRLSAHSCGL